MLLHICCYIVSLVFFDALAHFEVSLSVGRIVAVHFLTQSLSMNLFSSNHMVLVSKSSHTEGYGGIVTTGKGDNGTP